MKKLVKENLEPGDYYYDHPYFDKKTQKLITIEKYIDKYISELSEEDAQFVISEIVKKLNNMLK